MSTADIEANIAGRIKAGTAIQLLMADLEDHEVRAAARALRAHADAILGPPEPSEQQLSVMSQAEAQAFLAQTCRYRAYEGVKWRDVPRFYMEAIADFGLTVQRFLRSEIGKHHA